MKGSNWIPTSNFLFFKKEDEDDDDGEKINHDNDDGKLNENKGDGKMKHSDDVKMKDDDDDDYDDGMKKDGEDGYDEYKRRVDWLLKSVVDANMNMLRVWGGGVSGFGLFFSYFKEIPNFTSLSLSLICVISFFSLQKAFRLHIYCT